MIPGTYELLIADVERAVKQNDWMIAKLCLTPALNYIPGCPLPFIIFTNGTSFGNYDNFNLKSPQDAPHSHLGSPIGRSLAITRMNQPPDPESRVQLWIHLAWHILNQLLVFMPVWMNADGLPPLLPATYRMIFTCSEVSADRSFLLRAMRYLSNLGNTRLKNISILHRLDLANVLFLIWLGTIRKYYYSVNSLFRGT